MRVVVTPKANDSIKRIAKYIKQKFGDRYSSDFVDEIGKTLVLLSSNPYIGPCVDWLEQSQVEYRKLVVHRLNSLIYYVTYDCVYVVYCWDNRQNPESLKDKI